MRVLAKQHHTEPDLRKASKDITDIPFGSPKSASLRPCSTKPFIEAPPLGHNKPLKYQYRRSGGK